MNVKKLMKTALQVIVKGENTSYINSYGLLQPDFPYYKDELQLVAKKALDTLSFTKKEMIDYLTKTIGISESMLATLLDMTESSLMKDLDKSIDLIDDQKLDKDISLVNLFFFVKSALMVNEHLKNGHILGLLNEPLTILNQNTPLFYIIESHINCRDLGDDFLIDNLASVVEEFLKS